MELNEEMIAELFQDLMGGEPVTIGMLTCRVPLVEVNEKNETVVNFEVNIGDDQEPLRATLTIHQREADKV